MVFLASNDTSSWPQRFTLGPRLCEADALRVFTADQAKRYLEAAKRLNYSGDKQQQQMSISGRLQSLVSGGRLRTAKPLVHPILALTQPLVLWAPGTPEPDFDAVAWQAQCRWSQAPCPTRIFWLSEKAAAAVGRPAPRPKLFQLTHDIHMTELFLRFLNSSLASVWSWVPEDQVPRPQRRGYRVPDALLRSPHGQEMAIEFLGSYCAKRIRRFHQDCAGKQLSYQGW